MAVDVNNGEKFGYVLGKVLVYLRFKKNRCKLAKKKQHAG